jgi:hypothetical protein
MRYAAAIVACIALSALLAPLATQGFKFGGGSAAVRGASRPPGAPTVVFHEGRAQVWSPANTGFWGYSGLASMLENDGYRVTASSEPIDTLAPSLSAEDVLFIGVSFWRPHDVAEADAVAQLVESGGKVVLIGEHENLAWINEFPNEVAGRFGAGFVPDIVTDPTAHADSPFDAAITMDNWVLASSLAPLAPMEDVVVPAGCPIELPLDGIPLLKAGSGANYPGAVIAGAVTPPGGGKLLCIGDSEMFWNGNDGAFLRYGDNERFAMELFNWLSGGPPAVAEARPEFSLVTGGLVEMRIEVEGAGDLSFVTDGCTVSAMEPTAPGSVTVSVDVQRDGHFDAVCDGKASRVIVLSGEGTAGRALVEESWGSRRADDSPWGLLDFAKGMRDAGLAVFAGEMAGEWDGFDSVVVANPRAMPSLAPPKGSRLLVADGYQSTFSSGEATWQVFELNGCPNPDAPSSSLLEPRGFAWSGRLLYDPARAKANDPLPSVASHTFGPTFKTASVATLGSTPGEAMVLLTGTDGSWGEAYDPFGGHFNKVMLTMDDVYDSAGRTVAAATYGTMAFGALEALTNEASGREGVHSLRETVADWLAMSVAVSRDQLSGELKIRAEGTDRIGTVRVRGPGGEWIAASESGGAWLAETEGLGLSSVRVDVSVAGTGYNGTYHFTVAAPGGPYHLGFCALVAGGSAAGLAASVVALRRMRLRKGPKP